VDEDPWGKSYKLVMGKIGSRNQGADSRGREATIADYLFPAAPPTNWDEAPSPAIIDIFEDFDISQDTRLLEGDSSVYGRRVVQGRQEVIVGEIPRTVGNP